MNRDVDLSRKIPILDLTAEKDIASGITIRDITDYLKALAANDAEFNDLLSDALVSVVDTKVRSKTAKAKRRIQDIASHIAVSGGHVSKGSSELRNAALIAVDRLINHSVLVESVPNYKADKKADVAMYHYFYTPVSIMENGAQKTYTLQIAAEEDAKKQGRLPLKLDLYDLSVRKQISPLRVALPSLQGQPMWQTGDTEISIGEMLHKVKNFRGEDLNQQHLGKITLPTREGDYARITLGKNANKSTFVHELAHFYLYILRDMSSRKSRYNDPTWNGEPAKWNSELKVISNWWRENAEAIAKEAVGYVAKPDSALDGEAFISWGNDGMEKDSEAGLAFDRAAHEYFARGFERYLAEGEAPSAEMQGVFLKFKHWLCEIYRNLTQPDVELSSDIRGVFDRMLATDDAIRRMQAQRNLDRAMEAFAFENGGELGYSSMVEEVPGVGVDVDSLELMPDEYESAAEKVLRELLQEMSLEQADEFEKRSAEVRPQASSEVMRDSGFSAMLFVVDDEDLKLNRHSIINAFGQEFADAMPPNTTTDEGGMKDLEIAASGLNFASAEEMIASLVGKSTMNEAINRRVKDILAPEFIEKHKNAQFVFRFGITYCFFSQHLHFLLRTV